MGLISITAAKKKKNTNTKNYRDTVILFSPTGASVPYEDVTDWNYDKQNKSLEFYRGGQRFFTNLPFVVSED